MYVVVSDDNFIAPGLTRGLLSVQFSHMQMLIRRSLSHFLRSFLDFGSSYRAYMNLHFKKLTWTKKEVTLIIIGITKREEFSIHSTRKRKMISQLVNSLSVKFKFELHIKWAVIYRMPVFCFYSIHWMMNAYALPVIVCGLFNFCWLMKRKGEIVPGFLGFVLMLVGRTLVM